MKTTMTISLELDGSLLTARVRGCADELAAGTRMLDAVGAECTRLGADRVLVDFSELAGPLLADYGPELEQYASARLARLRCAIVRATGGDDERRGVSVASEFATFETEAAALDWLQRRTSAPATGTPARAAARTLVHLI